MKAITWLVMVLAVVCAFEASYDTRAKTCFIEYDDEADEFRIANTIQIVWPAEDPENPWGGWGATFRLEKGGIISVVGEEPQEGG